MAFAETKDILTPEVLLKRFWYGCETEKETLENIKNASYRGDAKIEWFEKAPIDTQAREYQREKVAPLYWKQQLMTTVVRLSLGYADCFLNPIHIRVKHSIVGVDYEVIDGQQRVTTVTDFLNNKFPLDDDFRIGDLDVGGMYADQLLKLGGEYKDVIDALRNFEIPVCFYENLTDQETSDYFVYKLNNVNTMNEQEMRNAILGAMTRWIRNTARGDKKQQHPLFDTVSYDDGETKELIHFRTTKKTKKIDQKMERDQWLANLTYLALGSNGTWRSGLNQKKVTDFYKSTQTSDGKFKNEFSDENVVKKLLDIGLAICKFTPEHWKYKLSSMVLTVMIMHCRDMQKANGSLNIENYVHEFFRIGSEWSDTKLKKYNDLFEANGKTPMKTFWESFHGMNSNAINTICTVLDQNMQNVVENVDTRNFSEAQIRQKLAEQGGVCAKSGHKLMFEECAGDHIIPRSAGIDHGGVTEMHNLQVIHRYHNTKKGAMTDEQYRIKSKVAA